MTINKEQGQLVNTELCVVLSNRQKELEEVTKQIEKLKYKESVLEQEIKYLNDFMAHVQETFID